MRLRSDWLDRVWSPRAIAAACVTWIATAGGLSAPLSHGQTPAPEESAPTDGRGEPAAVREILAASRAYVEALDRGDGATLSRMWTPDGDIIDERGDVRSGRETAAAVTPMVDNAEAPQLRIRATAIRLLSDTVGLEDGIVEVQPPGGGSVRRGRFTATWVKQDGGWKLAGVRENRFEDDGGAARLAELDWMVGDWDVFDAVSADDDSAPATPRVPRLRVTVRWNSTRTFLIRELRMAKENRPADDGSAPHDGALVVTQRIGWDPASRQIRSWSFGEDGSHGEGAWNHDGDSWFVRTSSVLPDGSTATAVNVYRFDGGDSCTWQSFPTHAAADTHAPVTATMVRRKAR